MEPLDETSFLRFLIVLSLLLSARKSANVNSVSSQSKFAKDELAISISVALAGLPFPQIKPQKNRRQHLDARQKPVSMSTYVVTEPKHTPRCSGVITPVRVLLSRRCVPLLLFAPLWGLKSSFAIRDNAVEPPGDKSTCRVTS